MDQSQSSLTNTQSHPEVLDSLQRLKKQLITEESVSFEGGKESESPVHNEKKIQQLLFLFQKNGVIQNSSTIDFVEKMLAELPTNLVENIYEMYSSVELAKLQQEQELSKIKN